MGFFIPKNPKVEQPINTMGSHRTRTMNGVHPHPSKRHVPNVPVSEPLLAANLHGGFVVRSLKGQVAETYQSFDSILNWAVMSKWAMSGQNGWGEHKGVLAHEALQSS